MRYVDVTTQAELDAAFKKQAKDSAVVPRCVGDGRFLARGSAHVEAWGSAHVVARGSAHVEAWGSAHVVAGESAHVVARGSAHVEARGSAHVEAGESAHVVARGSAHVEAWGSAHVVAGESAHVVARGSAHVVARGSAHVVAGSQVAVHQHSDDATITGGVLIKVTRPTTAEEWCAFYGVTVTDGIATVYKTLRHDYRSGHGFLYTPGTTPEAPDWDGGQAECGGGFHFSPHPAMALEFDDQGTKFIACPVALADMRAPKLGDNYPQKIKARRLAGPIVEVDRYGAMLRTTTKD